MIGLSGSRLFLAMSESFYISPALRWEEFLRECGTLLVAFAPLDVILNERGQKWGWMLLFIAIGLCFFAIALISESRRKSGY